VAVSTQTYNVDNAALGATLAPSERHYIDIAGCRVIAVEQISCKLGVNSATVLRSERTPRISRDKRYLTAAARFEEKVDCYSWETGSSVRAGDALPSA
jgi:hypothetical protein